MREQRLNSLSLAKSPTLPPTLEGDDGSRNYFRKKRPPLAGIDDPRQPTQMHTIFLTHQFKGVRGIQARAAFIAMPSGHNWALLQPPIKDGDAELKQRTTIGECPSTLESGSEKPFDFVMYCLLQKFIIWNRRSGERPDG
jgi:hypothetical protein